MNNEYIELLAQRDMHASHLARWVQWHLETPENEYITRNLEQSLGNYKEAQANLEEYRDNQTRKWGG